MTLKTLIGSPLTRMRYVTRYSSIFVVHKESVAEHSYFVALYSLLIGEWVRMQGHDVCEALLLRKAILHDIEECRTGDILRTFKYAHEDIKAAVDAQAEVEVFGIIENLGFNPEQDVYHGLHKDWKDSKDHTIEGCIVAFADFLSVLMFMMHEIDCSNVTMLNHHRTMTAYAQGFKDERFKFLGGLVQEACDITMEYLGHGGTRKGL